LPQDLATRLHQQVQEPVRHREGRLRQITIRSAETDVVSAAVIGLFTDIAGLGELLSVDRGADGEQVFVVRTVAGDHELLDLLAMHVERRSVHIAAPADVMVPMPVVVGRGAASQAVAASVRVDAGALRRLLLLARTLTRDSRASRVSVGREGPGQLQRSTEALCQGLEELCCAPASSLFERVPPLLERLSKQLDKQFALSLTGGDTRFERAVLQSLADPLIHLVRNACDHGIEPAQQRQAAGKPVAGRIDLSAWREPGRIRISVRDDGAGLSRDKVLHAARLRAIPVPDELDDDAVWQLVFAPGLSTAAGVSEVSGRGVGMDVVRSQVVAAGGDVSVTSSSGKGACVTMSIPDDGAMAPDAPG
jgi:two-component system chemotaxis sensor kinase CheA